MRITRRQRNDPSARCSKIALERVPLPGAELVAKIGGYPTDGFGAVAPDNVGGSGCFQTGRDELDRFRCFPGVLGGEGPR